MQHKRHSDCPPPPTRTADNGSKTVLLGLVCLWLVLANTAVADATRQLQNKLSQLGSFSAEFSQRLISAEAATVQSSSGRMAFKRPFMFRWVYQTPYLQQLISDGKTLWVFDQDLAQATKYAAADHLRHSPLSILNDPRRIPLLYRVELLSDKATEQQIKLTPRDENAEFKFVVLVFANTTLLGMKIRDNFDQYNIVSLHNINTNAHLDDDAQFRFTPPANVDVIDASKAFE